MSKSSQKVKSWRQRTKERIILAMGGKCVCCGYNKCQASLALHHLDPKEKDFSFGAIRANCKSWNKIVVELRKCILVCVNCHGEIHYGLTKVPSNATKFNEKYTDYLELERKERENDPSRYHECPRCKKDTSNTQKYCSQKCSALAALRFNWNQFNLEEMYKKMTVTQMAKIIGCSDVAIHKRLKRIGIK